VTVPDRDRQPRPGGPDCFSPRRGRAALTPSPPPSPGGGGGVSAAEAGAAAVASARVRSCRRRQRQVCPTDSEAFIMMPPWPSR
jgi:hypothetical protein